MALLLCGIGVLSVCVSSQAGLTVEAEPGAEVTLWCEHSLTPSSFIFWFKQTNNSAPARMTCRYYSPSSSSSFNPCYIIPESKRTVMRVRVLDTKETSMNSTLTIPAAHHSDSGLYYCCVQKEKYLSFSSTTYLQIRAPEKVETFSKNPETSTEGLAFATRAKRIISEAGCTCNVLLMLVFGGVIVVLLSVLLFLLFIILKNRKLHRADFNSTLKKDNEEGEMVNYASLHFTNKKRKRSHRRVEAEDPNILYSSVR